MVDTGGDGEQRPRRMPGSWVVLLDAVPSVYVPAGVHHILSFPAANLDERDGLAPAFAALPALPRPGRRRPLVIEKVDGVPVEQSPYGAQLRDCGFVSDYRGLVSAGS